MPDTPARAWIEVPGASESQCRALARSARHYARTSAPKLSGVMAGGIQAVWGNGWYGLTWSKDYLWFQEAGTRPFTMWSLEGKTVPMWIDDPTGKERLANPKAKTRTTKSGKIQVLIFRKAKGVGKPGRIALREAGRPHTRPGRLAGAIHPGNVGVRWRNPGLAPRNFVHDALHNAARDAGVQLGKVQVG